MLFRSRLVDLLDRRAVTLSKVEIFVLDEVDQMLDLGFIHAIRKLTALLPKQRQNLFFSDHAQGNFKPRIRYVD